MACLPPPDPLDSEHPLLEPRPPSYSHTTVRRAFIVWLRCGQRNQFRDVCDYYHRLEAFEEKLSVEQRTISCNHEFSLFSNNPPTSPYLQSTFPHLYPSLQPETQCYPLAYLQNYQAAAVEQNLDGVRFEDIKEYPENSQNKKESSIWKYDGKQTLSGKEVFESSQVFRTDCKYEMMKQKNRIGLAFAKLNIDDVKLTEGPKVDEKVNGKNEGSESTGTSKKDILETSQMINNYCTDHQVPLKNFLENFKEHASRCELTNTVTNVGFYIKRKMVEAELDLAVKVHRAKVHNNENKENRFKPASPPKVAKSMKKCETLNVDNAALLDGFVKLSKKNLKTNGNGELKVDVAMPAARVFGVKDKNVEKTITVLKREDTNSIKSNKGFSKGHIAKVGNLKCWKM